MSQVVRHQIERLIRDAEALIPANMTPDLPAGEMTSGSPEWHNFEHEIWQVGEKVRQLMTKNASLRTDSTLQSSIAGICSNRNAKRGRQSFLMLLGYKCCQSHARTVASQLNDPCVEGHVIDTLIKMKAPGFVNEIQSFVSHRTPWVRKKAKTYCQRYADA